MAGSRRTTATVTCTTGTVALGGPSGPLLPVPLARGRGRRGGRGGRLGPPLALFVAALDVDNGSGISMAGYACHDAFHTAFLRAGQSCQASMTVWTRMPVFCHSSSTRQLHMLGWFCWLLVALCSLLLLTGPRCSASWPVCTTRTVMCSSVPAVACARLVLRVFCTSRCVPPVSRPRRLVGRPAAGSASWPVWTRGTVIWREGRRHHPCRCAEAHLHGFSDHGDSTVAVLGQGDRCPWYAGRVCRSCRFFQSFARCVQRQVPSAAAVHQQGRLHPRRGAEVFPWSILLVGPKKSPVAGHGGRCTCSSGCARSRSSTSLSWRRGLLLWSGLFSCWTW